MENNKAADPPLQRFDHQGDADGRPVAAQTGVAQSGTAQPAAPRSGAPRGDAQPAGRVGNVLRSVYQQMVEESVPDEMIDLLGRLD